MSEALLRRVWSNRQLRARLEADEANSGGSGSPVNWASFQGVPVPTLDSGNSWAYGVTAADLSLATLHQSGSDFSVADSLLFPGHGAISSAGGGRFQAAVWMEPKLFGDPAVVLDAGSTKQRFLWCGAIVGSGQGGSFTLGLDAIAPVVIGDDDYNGILQATTVSVIGYSGPGEVVVDEINLSMIAPFGTDSIPVVMTVLIWQV